MKVHNYFKSTTMLGFNAEIFIHIPYPLKINGSKRLRV